MVTGARLCTPCQYIIPPRSEYPFNYCYCCRIEAREQRAKKTHSVRASAPLDQANAEEAVNDVLGEGNVTAKPHPGRCRNRDCGVVVHGPSECWQCTSRRMGGRARGRMTRGDAGAPISEETSGPPNRVFSRATSCSGQSTNRLVNDFSSLCHITSMLMFRLCSYLFSLHIQNIDASTSY